jgi:hypothetical protein
LISWNGAAHKYCIATLVRPPPKEDELWIESKAADRPREGSREAAFSFRTVGKQGAD